MSLRRSLTFVFALAVAALALGIATPAGAVDNPDYTAPAPTTVVPTSVQAETTPETTPQAVKQTTAVPAANQRLAITGSDAAQMAVVGVALLGAGGAIMAVRRRVSAA